MESEHRTLIKAIEPFMFGGMEQHLLGHPDDVAVRLEVSGRDGYGLMLTLGDLRVLWEAYVASCLAESLFPASP